MDNKDLFLVYFVAPTFPHSHFFFLFKTFLSPPKVQV